MVQWVQKNARERAVQTSILDGLTAGVIGNRRLDVWLVALCSSHDGGYPTGIHSGAGPLLSRSIN